MLYVYRFAVDMYGMSFPKAIQHTYTGLYISTLCLAGLCLIKSAIPQAVLMLILAVGVLIIQFVSNNFFRPLIKFLPLSMQDVKRYAPDDASIMEGTDDAGDAETLGATVRESADESSKRSLDTVPLPSSEDANPLPITKMEDYTHEALKQIEPIAWLPRDEYGFADAEIAENAKFGVQAACHGAHINDQGQVQRLDHCDPPDFVRLED